MTALASGEIQDLKRVLKTAQFPLTDRPRGWCAHVIAVQMDISPITVAATVLNASTDLLPDAQTQALLETIAVKLGSLSIRLYSIERYSRTGQMIFKQV